MEVPAHRPEVGLVFDDFGAEPPLEHMTGPSVPTCPPDGVTGEESLHAAREIGLGSAEEQMEVIGHQDEGEEFPAEKARGALQRVQPVLPVAVVADDVLAAVAAGHDMMESTRVFEAQSPRHD